jgi:hypothetical protein
LAKLRYQTTLEFLVFMLARVKACWKQVVGYYFTGNSVKTVIIINDIIKNRLQKVKPLGFNIVNLTSNMGAGNQALWKVWEITAGRHSDIKSKTSHSTVENKSVYSESYCNMHIPNLIRGRKVNHSFLSLLPSLGQ